MANPILIVWGGAQLLGVTSLPQFNATSGMRTRSIQIANNSDVALLYRSEKGVDIVISARYQMNAPLEANAQYSLSLASGQVGSQLTGQQVTLAESEQESTYSSQPLSSAPANLSVSHVHATFTGLLVNTATTLTTWAATAAKPAIVAAHLASDIPGTSPGAAQGPVQLRITDGTNNWYLCSVLADEATNHIDNSRFSVPTVSGILNPNVAWTAQVVCGSALSGTPTFNVDVFLDWVS